MPVLVLPIAESEIDRAIGTLPMSDVSNALQYALAS
jgi:hypothetical protein